MVPPAGLRHITTALTAYWRAQSSNVQLTRPADLAAEEAQRAEDVAVKIMHDMFKLRADRKQPTPQEFLDLQQGGALRESALLLDRMVSASKITKNLQG
jgi:hypothetical protein